MKRLFKHLLLFLCLGLIFNTSVTAETKWITKKNSKTTKVKTLEQMYVDGLLTRNECIKAKKKILKSQSVPGCKKDETEEKTVAYTTKKKEETWDEINKKYHTNKLFNNLKSAKKYYKDKSLSDLVYIYPRSGHEFKEHWEKKYPNEKNFKAFAQSKKGSWSWRSSYNSETDAVKRAIDRCNEYEEKYSDPQTCVVVKVGDKHLTYSEQAKWSEKLTGTTTLAAKLIKEKSSSKTYIAKKEKKKKKEEKKLITKKKELDERKDQIDKIERLTPGDYYLFAYSTSGERFWGSTKAKNKKTQIGKATSSNGYICDLTSKQITNSAPYKGSFKLKCPTKAISGAWTQECDRCNGLGQAFTTDSNVLTAVFSRNQSEIAQSVNEYFGSNEIKVAKKKKKKEKKVAKKKVEKYVPDDEDIDNIKPKIEIASSFTFKDPDYVLKGKVTDKGGSEKVYLFIQKGEGKERRIKLNNGKFNQPRFSYDNEEIKLIARDEYRNETIKIVKVNIVIEEETEVASVYDELKPIIKGIRDSNRVALIIGVETYTNTPVKALYAKNDAEKFKNFANRSLGISASNIKVLIDSKAKRLDAVEALKLWLPKKITPNESELFVFFSGHGYPSEKEGLHLIPQDGDPRLLEESALSHRYVIDQIIKTKPKSVTMFLDACYSGQSRTDEVLIAGLKQIKHVDDNEDIPANFNIFSSSKSSQVSATIEQAEHGIFSYYLMEGLTGKADLNKDRQITNIELFVYLQDNISEEAFKQNREQNPILTSQNPDQILMKY